MATGRIGVTPTLRTRWSKQPSAGTTSLSGLDDNSVSLVYDVGYEAVYRNGVLLSRGNDYTATSGTSITLIDATLTGDVIEVLANQLVPLTDAISKGQFTAKGALLSATAASTPGVLTVGANDTVLTADSTTSTGLKWATPASGGMTLLSTTTLSGVSTAITGIPSTYNSLQISWELIDISSNDDVLLVPNNTATTFNNIFMQRANTTNQLGGGNLVSLFLTPNGFKSANTQNAGTIIINNYASAAAYKPFQYYAHSKAGLSANNEHVVGGGVWASNTAISSLYFTSPSSISGGTVRLYGVK